jgi:periplasmic divalent cation tolerance protein
VTGDCHAGICGSRRVKLPPATRPCEDPEWLANFTRHLVDDHVVACGHNIAPIRAIYRWEGKVYDEAQARVGLHTRASLVPEIVALADRNHPDNVPCVIALPIAGGHEAYLQWIYVETDAASSAS